MNVIELFAPKGSLDEERRRLLGERLVTELVDAPGAPPDVVERGRALSTVLVHEAELWTVGGRPVRAAEPPRFFVRVSLPGGHLDDAMRAEVIARVTRALAGVDDHPERFAEGPAAVVQVVSVPDGSAGALGRVLTTADVTQLVLTGALPAGPEGAAAPRPRAVDPVCGMTVELDEGALTLEHDGTVHAFCCEACRDLFASAAAS